MSVRQAVVLVEDFSKRFLLDCIQHVAVRTLTQNKQPQCVTNLEGTVLADCQIPN